MNDRGAISDLRLKIIAKQRQVLLHERAEGTFGSGSLRRMLAKLDADQLAIEIRRLDD